MRTGIAYHMLGLIVAASSVASSCPVCFGETSSNTASAVNASVLVLLFITGAVLSMFGSFIFYLRKRMKISLEDNSTNHH